VGTREAEGKLQRGGEKKSNNWSYKWLSKSGFLTSEIFTTEVVKGSRVENKSLINVYKASRFLTLSLF